jgi:teichuronic acid biosynthesis glycosyltransferase TuaC
MTVLRDALAEQHVAVITTSYPTGPGDPSGHFVASEVRALRAAGARVTVLAPRVNGASRDSAPDVRWLQGGNAFGWPGALARLRAQPWNVAGVARFVLAARRELARLGDVDRIVAHFVVPSAWPIASASRLPLEVVAHGSDVRLIERLPRWLRRRLARDLAHAELRCVSEELRARLALALGRELGARARVQPAALELDASRDRAASRRRLGLERDARLVVVVGRLLSEKRVDVALRALRLVPRTLVVIVGDGPERARLEHAFPEARFVGRVDRDQALDFIAAADVLLSTSRLEGAPSVVREARALGTRVVASPAGDLLRWSHTDPGLSVLDGVV